MKPKNKTKGCLKGCGVMFIIVVGLFIATSILIFLTPEHANNINNNAQKLYIEKDYLKAFLENKKAISKDSLNANFYLLKAKIALELKDTIESKEALIKSQSLILNDSLKLKLSKEIIDWKLEKGDTLQVEKLLQNTLKIFNSNDFKNYVNSYYYVSDKMHEINKSKKGIQFLNILLDSIKMFSVDTLNFRTTYYQASQRFLKFHDTIQAIACLKDLTKEIPNSKLAQKKLGDYYNNKNDNKNAIKYFKKYLEIDTTNAIVFKDIGQCYLNIKYKKSAIKYFKIAAEKGNNEACDSLRELTARTRYYSQSRCCDGSTSSSTGRGACSHHGGVCRTEYIPYKEYTINCR